jgi:hypothetical protein
VIALWSLNTDCDTNTPPSLPETYTTHGAASFAAWYDADVVLNATIDLYLVNDTVRGVCVVRASFCSLCDCV